LRALKDLEISMEQLDLDCKKYRLPYLGAERAIFTVKVHTPGSCMGTHICTPIV